MNFLMRWSLKKTVPVKWCRLSVLFQVENLLNPFHPSPLKLTPLYIFFYRQLDFSSQPGVANEILENEPKSCLTVA